MRLGPIAALHGSRATQFCESEVQNFYDSGGSELDVARFWIAMHDALYVSGFERIGNLPCNSQGIVQWNRAVVDPLRQRGSLDQLHHQIVGPDVEHSADVGVI